MFADEEYRADFAARALELRSLASQVKDAANHKAIVEAAEACQRLAEWKLLQPIPSDEPEQ